MTTRAEALAIEALRLANVHSEGPDLIVQRAKVYRQFLEGQIEAAEPPPVIANPAEPGLKRKRRTKPEEMNGVEDHPDEHRIVEPIPAFLGLPPQNYKAVQDAMLRLFDKEYGFEATRDILDSLGVRSAQDLKPEQYADCIERLQEALSGKPLV